jgi:hypothetical protein
MNKNYIQSLIALILISIVTGCNSTVANKFKISSEGPDEFLVMAQSTLSLPKDFDLPTPVTEQDVEAGLVVKDNYNAIKTSIPSSKGEELLLNKASEASVMFNGDAKNNDIMPIKKSFLEKLNFLNKKKNSLAKDSTMNPEADKGKRTYSNKSMEIIVAPPVIENNSKRCEKKGGIRDKSCDEFKFMKNFPVSSTSDTILIK